MLEDVYSFSYLGSKIDKEKGRKITARIRKAQTAFVALGIAGKSRDISLDTTLRLCSSNVVSVLL